MTLKNFTLGFGYGAGVGAIMTMMIIINIAVSNVQLPDTIFGNIMITWIVEIAITTVCLLVGNLMKD